jgi:hypothetical protein
MPLEAATYINDLVVTNPPSSDSKSQGDDHLRLIKAALKATFPLAVGARKFRDDTASAADTLVWNLFRNRNGVAGDSVGSYLISGRNNIGTEVPVARMRGVWIDPGDVSEDSGVYFYSQVAGVETLLAYMYGGGIGFQFPLIGAGKPPTNSVFSANGTWTRPAGCRYIIMIGVGGGGGSGGLNGIGTGKAGAVGGGGGGWGGMTNLASPASNATAAVTIGAAGAAGGVGLAGGNGGTTSITIGGVTYTWPGGIGSNGYTANVSEMGSAEPGDGGAGGNGVNGWSQAGTMGISQGNQVAGQGNATGGNGGSSWFGKGGKGAHVANSTLAENGGVPTGFGAGGGGPCTNNAGDAGGRAGGSGLLKILEFY